VTGFRISMRVLKAKSLGRIPRNPLPSQPARPVVIDPLDPTPIAEPGQAAQPVRRLGPAAVKAYEAELLARKERTGR
jgi:hypothetical protein